MSSPSPSLQPKLGQSFLVCLALALVLFCLGLWGNKEPSPPSNLCVFSCSSKDVEFLKHDNWEATTYLLCSRPSPEATNIVSSEGMCAMVVAVGLGGGAEERGEKRNRAQKWLLCQQHLSVAKRGARHGNCITL